MVRDTPSPAFCITMASPLPHATHTILYLQSAVGFNEMEAPTTAYKKTTPIEAGEL